MMFVMGVGGLMVTANLAKLADTFKITAAALIFAASMNPIANGASRLSWGWVSDHIGRERTMVIAFLIQSASLVSVPLLAPGSDTAFIVCLAVVYFSWGEIYSLFPSLTADLFGSRNASANYGFLYSTKGAAAIVGGYLAPMLFEKTGSWSVVFYGGAIMTFIRGFDGGRTDQDAVTAQTPERRARCRGSPGASCERIIDICQALLRFKN